MKLKKPNGFSRGVSCLLVLMMTFVFSRVLSADLEIKKPYTDQISEKLGRGIVNIALSPVEITRNVEAEVDKDQPQAAATTGVLKGVFRMVKRIFVGTFEIATFYVPSKPIMKPEYVIPDKGIAQ